MRAVIRSRRVALPLAALALAGTGVAAYGAVGDDGPGYRTVTAGIGSVEQELTVSGTIAPSGSTDLAFGTTGTVAQVKVAQGDEVEQGDVVAVLDRASLRAAVDEASASLASAKAQLADDRDAQTTAVSTASGAAATTTTPRATTTTTTPTKQSADPRLAEQQDAVLKAQTAASTALASAEKALADQQEACADPVATTEPTAGATPTDGATDGTTDAPTPSPATSAVLSEACSGALAAVQSAQTSASEAQSALQKALTALSGTLTKALASAQSQPAASAPAASAPSASTPAASAPSASTPDAGRSVTAATLAQDQASIDRAAAELAAAKADLAGAVVRAPADGTVVSLAVAKGGDVSAGDTVATVVAPGLTTVTAEVSATQAAQLRTGLDVEVTPAGATEALAGAVSRVEHVATSSTTSDADPTYTVEVVLDERDLPLADGMPASVVAVVGSAQDVVVVPASAVSDGTVTVVEDGTARRVRVSTGIVGATEIEVTDGLAKGDEVVLADLDADLPSGDSTQQGPGGFGGGGLPGGGTPPTGFRMRG